ncbi:MAG: MFS transporter [Acidobacteriota bacterium]|nr:MFS transporter [Acidobacteriota bacterium]
MDLAFATRALRSRNYRLFFTGQGISLIGTWMTRIATSWLVYRLTHSAALLGIVGFASQIPAFLLGPMAGVWLDRWNRHRAIVVTQVLSMVQSFALAFLALAGIVTTWEIVVLALFQGVINAFDMPARQSFVIEMVERREDLPNAIALNSSMVNAARLIGPAIAGVLVAGVGEGYCFLIDGISFIAVIIGLLMMHTSPVANTRPQRHVVHELVEGWRYVTGSVPIRSILINLSIVSLFGMPYSTLMPIYADQILGGGAHTLGFLTATTGIGAFIGAVTLVARRNVVGLVRRIILTSAIFGAAVAGFGVSRWLWLSLLLLVAAGYGMMQQMASSNTILQTIVEDEKRGRVMSFYSMALQGMAPFGSLMAGSLASRVGAPMTVLISGLACVAGAIWFGLNLPRIRKVIRPIYVRLGILQDLE